MLKSESLKDNFNQKQYKFLKKLQYFMKLMIWFLNFEKMPLT